MLPTQPSIPPVINCRTTPSCTLALLLPSFRNLFLLFRTRIRPHVVDLCARIRSHYPAFLIHDGSTHSSHSPACVVLLNAGSFHSSGLRPRSRSLWPGLYSPSSTRLPLARRASLPSLAPCAPPHSAILTPPPPHSALLTPPPPHSSLTHGLACLATATGDSDSGRDTPPLASAA